MAEPRIPTSELIASLQRVGGDDPPTETEYADADEYSAHTIKKRFDTWNAALAAAGYPVRPKDAKVDVDIEAIVDRYFRQAMSLPDVADDLGHAISTIQNRLEEAGLPANLPKNVRYLLFNPPTPVDDLPSQPSPSDRRLGVTTFRIQNGRMVAFLEREHTAEDAVRAFLNANPNILDGMHWETAIAHFGGHGPAFREAARQVLDEDDFSKRR